MPEMNSRQPRLTYSACGPFTKNIEDNKKLKRHNIHNIFIKTN